ncbi:hypothetical protein ACE6H2_028150 [Prunus campanulata]
MEEYDVIYYVLSFAGVWFNFFRLIINSWLRFFWLMMGFVGIDDDGLVCVFTLN